MSLKKSILDSKGYLGQMNMFKIPYLSNWSQNVRNVPRPNLVDMLGYIQALLSSDPPIEQPGLPNQGVQYVPQQKQQVQQVSSIFQDQIKSQQNYGQGYGSPYAANPAYQQP
mmetsp:Transcript_46079/g.33862  ORF Transcript_46079/g.33862 Transcript_46079/m.33862 type:complete len:112 (-) Transcript_46079:81-416(-)